MKKDINESLRHRVVFRDCGLSVRENREAGGSSIVERVVEGVAIVTGQETVLFENDEFREVEVIESSCLSAEFMAEQDVKLNLLHIREMSLARNNKGVGTLELEVEADGLHFCAPMPDCDLGKRAVALVDNQTYTGCSFEFWPQDYILEEREGKDGKHEYVIRHTAFKKLGAITIGMDPAYEQTSVNAREVLEAERGAKVECKSAMTNEAREMRERKLRLSDYTEE